MSREQSVNIEQLVRAAYSALNRRDLEAFKEVIDPEVEFTSLIAEAEAETYQGHAGVSRWWETVMGAFDDVRYELRDVRALGDQVITETHIHAMLGGVEVEQTMWQVLLIRDERAVSWAFFRTEREALEALEAVGLSE
jgi:ketosteroid isomerase-like protein